MRAKSVILVGALVSILLSGCGLSTTPPTKSPASPNLQPIDANTIAVQVGNGWSYSPALYLAQLGPWLVIYGSGRVLQRVEPSPQTPSGYEESQIDPMSVASFVYRAKQSGLLENSKAYGNAQVTDVGGTTVTVADNKQEASVSVWALDESFDSSVKGGSNAANRRKQLRALIEEAQKLDAGTTKKAFIPERLLVIEASNSYSKATILWPGPDPDQLLTGNLFGGPIGGKCGWLTGPAMAKVLQASASNKDRLWLVGGKTRQLALNSLPSYFECN